MPVDGSGRFTVSAPQLFSLFETLLGGHDVMHNLLLNAFPCYVTLEFIRTFQAFNPLENSSPKDGKMSAAEQRAYNEQLECRNGAF